MEIYPAYDYDSPLFHIRWMELTFGVWLFTLAVLVILLVVVRRWWALGALVIGVLVVGLAFFSFGLLSMPLTERHCWGPRAMSGAPDGASSDSCYRFSQVQLAFAFLSPLGYLVGLRLWRRARSSPGTKLSIEGDH